MADYVFKVQLLLPGNVIETVILRQYIDPVDRCFDRFKTNLIQRFDILTNATFKMMWIDNDGDKISIFNEEDLRTYMELKGTKIFVEVDDGSNRKEKKSAVDNAVPPPLLHRPPHYLRSRLGERERPMCGGRYRMFPQPDCCEVNGNDVDAGSTSSGAQPVLHVGVTCDGCNCAIRGYRYKCIECPDYDLCFSCEMKKLHGDHLMLRIVKPLDRPFNRHFLKAMLKRCRDSCEEKDKDKRARGRHSTAFVNFDDIMTDIAKNISVNCTTQPSNETRNAEQNKAGPSDAKQFALNSETFAKAGEVLSNLAQHFVSVMDPFAVHEFIPATQSNDNSPNAPTSTVSGTPNEPNKTNGSSIVIEENQDKNGNEPKTNAAPAVVPTPLESNTPIVPAETVPVNSPKDLVTIEDDVEIPSANREPSPTPDWAMVDAFGYVEEGGQPQKNTGAIPKTPAIPTPAIPSPTIPTPAISTPTSVGSVDAAQALPNYAILARDLEDHLHHTLKSQSSQTPPQMPIAYHPNPKINEAIITMTSMGFSNGGGWLTRLLENVDGDIPKALEKLHPSQ